MSRQEMKDLKHYWYSRGFKMGMYLGFFISLVGFFIAAITYYFIVS